MQPSTPLGTMAELPDDYLRALDTMHARPAWPSLRSLIPDHAPERRTLPHRWSYQALRPLLLRAGELTPMDRAERRVLMLANPGLEGRPFASSSIFLGLQLLLPGERAPNHRHSPSAVRMILEGEGAYTHVEGQRLPMRRGDVILTPAHLWHEHGNDGHEPSIWLDALDVPLTVAMEAAYGQAGSHQTPELRADASQTRYRRAGLLPYECLGRPAQAYPMFRYPWDEVRTALLDLASDRAVGEPVQLAYVNPETGRECMPVLGFSALMLRPGESLQLPRSSASRCWLVLEGEGETTVGESMLSWQENDVLCAPTHCTPCHRNASPSRPAFLIQVDDAPMQRRLGFHEEG